MRIVRVAVVLVATLLAPFSSALLHAHKSPVAASLESHIATSEKVFVAQVAHVGKTTGVGESSHTPIDFDVVQTLKGEAARSLSLDFIPNWYRWRVYPYSMASLDTVIHSKRLLLCMRGNSVLLFDLDNPDLQVLSDSPLSVLRNPDAVVKAAKAAAMRYPIALANPKIVGVNAGSSDVLKDSEFSMYDNVILAQEQH